MGKIIACIDGSPYKEGVCELSGWLATHTGHDLAVLHVAIPHEEMQVKGNFSGAIGLGAKSGLLRNLTEVDEAHGRLEQHKGHLMLEEAETLLAKQGLQAIEILHRWGSLAETIEEYKQDAVYIVMGKYGEHTTQQKKHLGSNLERVIRSFHIPVLVATKTPKPIKRLLIAYDGSQSAKEAISHIASTALFKHAECHLIKVCEATGKAAQHLQEAEEILNQAGLSVHASIEKGKSVDTVVSTYIQHHEIDLLVMGAYGHSKIRSMILGSVTTALISKTDIPVLLFH